MRALIFENKKLTLRRDYPVPELKYNEALVRVTAAGICGTDLEIAKGYMGFQGVPGHEFVGVVEQCGEEAWVGERVAGEINIGCGVCPFCLSRMRNHCPNRSVLGILQRDGAFADYLALPVKNLHRVPSSITEHEAVFIEPLAAALEILHQVHISPDHKVCVLGDGRLGLLTAQVLALTECSLEVVGRHERKLDILRQRGIVTARESDLAPQEFDVVVDCSGSASALETALRLVKPRGTLVLKTTVAEREGVDLNKLVIDEITLVGSRCGPFAPAIRCLVMKQVEVLSMIAATYKLEEGPRAFDHAARPGILKVLLEMK